MHGGELFFLKALMFVSCLYRNSKIILVHELVQLNQYLGLDTFLHSELHLKCGRERSRYLYSKYS